MAEKFNFCPAIHWIVSRFEFGAKPGIGIEVKLCDLKIEKGTLKEV